MTNTALVLGATGGIGGEIARALLARGWRVRALHRTREGTAQGIDWVRGDVLDAEAVAQAARGAAIIVHAVNPPGYRNWEKVVLPMLDSTIAAAQGESSLIVLPGTVYNFGTDVLPEPDEDSPQTPQTKKGRIRAEMEARLGASGARVLIVRAGDFFGPSAGNTWFSQGLVTAGKPVRAIVNPGRKGMGHQWAYLPDLAETFVRLIEMRASLPGFAVYHFRGHWDGDGTQMIAAIRAVLGRHVPVRAFPWKLVKYLSPFVAFFREVREMRYLWKTPLYMRNDRLEAVIGAEPHTPWDVAVRASLEGAGCLEREKR